MSGEPIDGLRAALLMDIDDIVSGLSYQATREVAYVGVAAPAVNSGRMR